MSDKTPGPTPDQAMFENLYKQVHDRLLQSVAGMVRDRDRAEDITAAAFQTAWEKRAQFRGESSLSTWLYAIARNTARDSWREERLSRRDPVDHLETPRFAEPDRSSLRLEQDELRARIRETLDRIPASCRRILIAHHIEGRSLEEIARRERVPIGTVGSRLFAARRLLREAWPPTAAGSATNGKRPMSSERKAGETEPPMSSSYQAASVLRPATPHPSGEQVRAFTDEALRLLSRELEKGRSQVLTNYLAAMGRFHRYSLGNTLLIYSQRPEATQVAGYHAWHDLGRYVKRGEKGIMIFAPILARKLDSDRVADDGKSQETSRIAGFRAAYVFDVAQTEGRPLPQFATTAGDPQGHLDRLKALVAKQDIALEYDPSIAPAQGTSSGGRIRLVPGMEPAEEFSVLTHELAHEMLHHGQGGAGRSGLSKAMRETQAEAVAFVVSRGIGLETGTAAADYIALYDRDAKNAAKTLADSLAVIQESSSRILRQLLPEERVPGTLENTFEAPARPTSEPQPTPSAPSRAVQPAAPPAPEPGDSLSWDR